MLLFVSIILLHTFDVHGDSVTVPDGDLETYNRIISTFFDRRGSTLLDNRKMVV